MSPTAPLPSDVIYEVLNRASPAAPHLPQRRRLRRLRPRPRNVSPRTPAQPKNKKVFPHSHPKNPHSTPRDAQPWSQTRTTASNTEDPLCAPTIQSPAPAPRPPNACQTLPKRPKPPQSAPSIAPVQNEPKFPLGVTAPLRHIPPQSPAARRRKSNPPLTPSSSNLPAERATHPFTSPDSPSFPPAKPAKTLQKPAKIPHFTPTRRAANPLSNQFSVNTYIHPLPQSRVHATFFPAQFQSAPA
ncbi:MAG: hypothetical protein JWN40_949 [Phycisphaerales bacterium]|nr:hypothetical protein [Phycisphaerales bacterium]